MKINKFILGFCIALLALVFVRCEDADPIPLATGNEMSAADIRFTNEENNKVFSGERVEDTYYFNIPNALKEDYDITQTLVSVSVSVDATVSPALDKRIDLSSPLKLKVTSATGVSKEYILQVRYVD